MKIPTLRKSKVIQQNVVDSELLATRTQVDTLERAIELRKEIGGRKFTKEEVDYHEVSVAKSTCSLCRFFNKTTQVCLLVDVKPTQGSGCKRAEIMLHPGEMALAESGR